MGSRRHVYALFAAIVGMLAASILMYRSLPVGGIAALVGSGAVTVILLAHFGILGTLIASFTALRRWSRR